MTILYGISNCSTVRKARQWLAEREIPYTFHDFRKDGVNPVQLRAWADRWGWEALVNKRGTTWRNLPEQTRQALDETLAFAVMEDQPSLIKRPILETSHGQLLGFVEADYKTLFQH